MDWIVERLPALLVGLGLILLLAFVTRGNLKGKKPTIGACENCNCHGTCTQEGAGSSQA